MKPRALSREEEAELARSNKKVKDWHHDGFNDGPSDRSGERSPPIRCSNPPNANRTSFKDTLIGTIPGAFAKAFDFPDQMDEDEDSDDDVAEVPKVQHEGMVAFKLTKETKNHIRKPWSKTIIVKLVGRSVGFSYMQNKLTQLWRPTGRMDCVDLTHGFFLVRFYAKEDLELVLDKGPGSSVIFSFLSGRGSRFSNLQRLACPPLQSRFDFMSYRSNYTRLKFLRS